MTQKVVFFLFIIIGCGIAQDFRTLRLSKIGDQKYQCVENGCSLPTIISGSYLRSCQMACISLENCRTITFDPSLRQCEVFIDTPNHRGNMLAQMGIVTMVVIADEQPSTCKRHKYMRFDLRFFFHYLCKCKSHSFSCIIDFLNS